jgi:hypothetical protein
VSVNLQGETTAEVDAKLEAAIEEMVKAHKDELQTKDGSTSYSTRIDTTNDVQVGGTPAQNSWVLKQWGFWAAQVTAPLLSDNSVKKPLK